MGRKRTHHDAARTKIVSARLTQETYDLISAHAEKLGLTRAGYVEHLIEDRPLRIVRPLADELPITFLNELKRIGNNLNQIAHARNAGQAVDPRHFQSVVTEIIATICSNEVLRRRYEEAEDAVRSKGGKAVEEELRLRKREPAARPMPATPQVANAVPDLHARPSPSAAATSQSGHRREPQAKAEGALSQSPAARELRLTAEDIRQRNEWSGRGRSPAAPASRDANPANPKVNRHGAKASSTWFKLPWRL